MKIAVIDIGLKATRLVLGDTDDIYEHGFRFEDYRTPPKMTARMTEAGKGILFDKDLRSKYCLSKFDNTIDFLKDLLRFCRNRGVSSENIYVVGTEAFSRVDNLYDLVDMVRDKCGIDIRFLNSEEETLYTFWAVIVSCRDYYEREEPFVVIEQGGSSMRIVVGNIEADGAPEIYIQESIIELGTTFLHQQFPHVRENETVQLKSLESKAEKLARSKVQSALDGVSLSRDKIPRKSFALGSVITNYFDCSSRDKHCKRVMRDQLCKKRNSALLDKFSSCNVNSFQKTTGNGNFRDLATENAEMRFERVCGSPCYAAVLDYFKIDHLRICGAGMRYGVLFKKAFDLLSKRLE